LTPFPAGVKVYSEAQLYTPFKARHRGDRLAEAHTHVDGIVGDFEIAGTKSGATLTPDWRYLAVFEAKMYSPLSSGTTNAPGYDQVSRTVACMIHAILAAGEMGDRIAHLVVLSPADNDKIDPGRYTSAYVAERIAARERTYLAAGQDGQPTARFTDAWCAVLPRIRIQFLTWEEVMAEIDSAMLDRFYDFCVQFNRP
jgi:hypothetical protein